jgi:hypothetical protein
LAPGYPFVQFLRKGCIFNVKISPNLVPCDRNIIGASMKPIPVKEKKHLGSILATCHKASHRGLAVEDGDVREQANTTRHTARQDKATKQDKDKDNSEKRQRQRQKQKDNND